MVEPVLRQEQKRTRLVIEKEKRKTNVMFIVIQLVEKKLVGKC